MAVETVVVLVQRMATDTPDKTLGNHIHGTSMITQKKSCGSGDCIFMHMCTVAAQSETPPSIMLPNTAHGIITTRYTQHTYS